MSVVRLRPEAPHAGVVDCFGWRRWLGVLFQKVNFSSSSEVNASALYIGDNPKEMVVSLIRENVLFSLRDWERAASGRNGFIVWNIDYDGYNRSLVSSMAAKLVGWSVYERGNIYDRFNIALATNVTDLLLTSKVSDRDVAYSFPAMGFPPFCNIVTWMGWKKPLANTAIEYFKGNVEKAISTTRVRSQDDINDAIIAWLTS